MTSKFRFFIKNAQKIQQCYSQEFQDIFVLSMTGGKTHGTYLEIGAGDPIVANNTFLLSSQFNWSGLSIDIDSAFTSNWHQHRGQDQFRCLNALTVDYKSLLNQHFPNQTVIDYLQLDVDPAHNTLECLTKLPHDQYRFRVITYETDSYVSGPEARNRSRQIFRDLGYELVVGDVLYVNQNPFEDWYVDPNLVNPAVWRHLKLLSRYSQIPAQLLLVEPLQRHIIGY
jgi:hypothetical protein